MKICSPLGHALTHTLTGKPRPRSLDGLRIGLLDNTKAPVDRMLEHLARRIEERIPGAKPFYVSKSVMGRPASPEALQSLRQNTDVVINALGD